MEEAWELAALVMSDKDEIEVSANDKGIAVKAKGGAATRLGHSFADALRFFTSPLGLAADEVDRFRIYRQVAFEHTLRRAHHIAVERNIETSNAPLKFLAQWGEAASLEDVDDPENLSEMWARLLLTSSKQNEGLHLTFVSILKSIAKKEAVLFTELASNAAGELLGPRQIFIELNKLDFSTKKYNEIHSMLNSNSEKKAVFESINNDLKLVGGKLCKVVVEDSKEKMINNQNFRATYVTIEPGLIGGGILSYNILEKHGLLGWTTDEFRGVDNSVILMKSLYVTDLGLRFYYATSHPKLSENQNHIVYDCI